VITLTEIAKNKIIKFLEKRGGEGIRLGVRTTGCSGLSYVLEYVDKYDYDNTMINYAQDKFCVLVDKKHDVYLTGTTIDYVRSGVNEGFEFKNPNERDKCGCGSSFRI
jgi:iron-sulfur cluster assembly protein